MTQANPKKTIKKKSVKKTVSKTVKKTVSENKITMETPAFVKPTGRAILVATSVYVSNEAKVETSGLENPTLRAYAGMIEEQKKQALKK